MASIDLIPSEHRHWLWQLHCLRMAAIGAAAFLLLACVVYALLVKSTEHYQGQLMDLQARQAISQQQQKKLENLSSQYQELERQWTLLNGLRGGLSVTDILLDIDHTLRGEEVWFVDWRFQRAGEAVKKTDTTTDTGYFIMVKRDASPNAVPEKWQISSHIKIKGQANDHVAFSGFVQRLLQQSSIADVRVINTKMNRLSEAMQIIEFEIAILVDNSKAYHNA